MLIRNMKLGDIQAAVEIEKKCFSQPWSEKSFQDSNARDDTVFLVCEDGTVTGYIGMYLCFDEASITNVAVSPEYRNRGYGELLVKAAKEAAKAAGAVVILLEVRQSNEPAISLYKKLGFEELGIRKNFYEHPVEDAIIMKVGI